MSIIRILSGVAILAAAISAPAVAAGPVQVTARVLVEQRTTAADGTTRVTLTPAARVTPGDRVVYQLDYGNTGAQPVGNFILSNPVPKGLAYLAPAAGSPEPDVSVDGATFAPLGALRVDGPHGVARPASASDVKIVRWRLGTPLAAGGHGQFAYRAVLR